MTQEGYVATHGNMAPEWQHYLDIAIERHVDDVQVLALAIPLMSI